MSSGFNPRPPRRTGATVARQVPGLVNPVSILARPEGRALRSRVARAAAWSTVSILARPEGRALPARSRRTHTYSRFQSSPAPKDGRYILAVLLAH